MTTRFIKPKIDKYIQLYSKYAKPEEVNGINGSISNIVIEESGYWYEPEADNIYGYPTVTISPPNQTGGVQAIAIVSGIAPLIEGGYITEITITEKGSGYTSKPTVTINDPLGTGEYTGAITYIFIDNGGTGYTSTPTVTISGGGGTGATAGNIIIEDGVIKQMQVFYSGNGNYTSTPTVTISGGGGTGATATAYLTWGFGATASAQIQVLPIKVKKYVWELDTAVEVDENALLQVVDRAYTNIPVANINDPIVIRMYEISTKSVVNTINNSSFINNSAINDSFYLGKIIDVGKPDRNFPNEIKFEIQPQNIHRITLSLNHGISDSSGVNFDMEFVILMKITEKEPSIIEYGSLNNINVNQI